jgi:GxxExxY protein
MGNKMTSVNSSFATIPPRTEEVTKMILDAAFKVHTTLGPGLLESVYEACLIHELKSCGLIVENQISLPVAYGGITVDSGLRIDLLVENCVIVEIKAVENIIPLYNAQLLTYLKLTKTQIGLLINFNTIHLRDGNKRLVN